VAAAIAIAALFMPWAIAQAETALQSQVAICAPCHGVDGKSTMAGIPSLAAQPEIFLVTQLILFREKLRKSEQMVPVAANLDDATIEKLAAHFAALPPVSSAGTVDPALMERGQLLAKAGRCGQCHLPDYAGRAQIPRLAGQREDYLRSTLIGYRDGTRGGSDTTMNDIMYGVSDADIDALAHFLAQQK
jgi:cytochrome c553